MKLLELKLLAFGPFTDVTLDLSAGREGLHLIHGPNEAGKSSTLRAIKQFLFGIPHRSNDCFVHTAAQLRIGGTLRMASGDVVRAVRRKGQKNTLRDGNDKEPIDEARWLELSGGIDPDVFGKMFGLGHETLVAGGREILEGGGEVGQLLFSAGAGVANLRAVRAGLRSEADELFKARGQRKINQTLEAIEEIKREIRDISDRSQSWIETDAALTTARAKATELRSELNRQLSQSRRLEQLRDARTLAARRRQLVAERASLGEVVLLVDDFRGRHRDALVERELVLRETQSKQEILQSLTAEMQSISIDDGLLERADALEELFQEISKIKKAEADRAILVAKVNAVQDRLRELASLLGWGDKQLAESPSIPARPLQVRLRELIQERDQQSARRDEILREAKKIAERSERLERESTGLGEVRNTDELERTLEQARRLGDISGRIADITETIDRETRAIQRQIAGWSIWNGRTQDFAELPLPSLDSIEAWEEALTVIREEESRVEKATREYRRRLDEIERQLAAPSEERIPPALTDLAEARQARDGAWRLVERIWRDGEKPAELDIERSDVGELFQGRLRRADDIADRLRIEADLVAARSALMTERESIHHALDDLEPQCREISKRKQEAESLGRELWKPANIEPKTPKEMKSWLREALTLRERVHRLSDSEMEKESIERRAREMKDSLREKLSPFQVDPGDGDWEGILQRSATVLNHARDSRARRAELESRRKELDHDAAENKRERAEWERSFERLDAEWRVALTQAGLSPAARASEARDALDLLQEWGERSREREGFHTRIVGIDHDSQEFADRVGMLGRVLGMEETTKSPVESIALLHSRMKSAKLLETRRSALQDQREKSRSDKVVLDDRLLRAEATLEALCVEAGGVEVSLLPMAADRSDQARRVGNDLRAVEERLVELSAGVSLEEFLKELDARSLEEMELEIESLKRTLPQLQEEISELDRSIGRLENELRRVDGSGTAAQLAEDMQSRLADLRKDAERYIRLEMACALLERSIERYRRENEGPLLRRASELFRELTLGSFNRLEADFDSEGRAVLVGIRPGQTEPLNVTAMSEGTADQLYLALRLASVEVFLDRHEPLPFIVDDILVNFDDARGAAALRILAELSRRTQVIFFTHHEHLVELAEKNVTDGSVYVHELPGSQPREREPAFLPGLE